MSQFAEDLEPDVGGTVRDIMQPDVTTVPPGLSVRELSRILADRGISGAPVVTVGGRLLGVVSASDVVRMAAEAGHLGEDLGPLRLQAGGARVWDRSWGSDEDPLDDDVGPYGDFFLPEEATSFLPFEPGGPGDGPFDEMTVEDIMTPVPFTVTPETGIRELAGFLRRGRIHRAVVTEDDTLVGIVTTMDILTAVAAGTE